MSQVIIPNYQDVKLATPVYDAVTDELAIVDLHPIVGWVCIEIGKDKSDLNVPSIATLPITEDGTPSQDLWATYCPDTELWDAGNRSGRGLDNLGKYFAACGESEQEAGVPWGDFVPATA